MPSTVEIIAQRLVKAGVKHAFGIPGGEVLAIIDALRDHDIQFTLVKHENAGGFMAEGTAHASGTPGVLVATLGPGVANAINFIANAQQDRVPIIFLSGCVDDSEAMRYTHQIFDHQALLRPITKATLKVSDGAVEETIDKALSIAMDEPQGPVHVDIPIGIATAEQTKRTTSGRCTPQYGALGISALNHALTQIDRARKPVAIAGIGVLQQKAERELREFLIKQGIPLITTYKAKGILPEDHALSLGGTGLSPKSESILLPFVAQADLVLLFGYDPIEMRPGWRNVWGVEATVLEFGNLVNTHYMHQSSQHYYCDLKQTLLQLNAATPSEPRWVKGEISAIRQANQNTFFSNKAWGPHAIIETTRQNLPNNTVATVDTGAHRILLSQMWVCKQPRTLLQSSALCTMGVAAPMALGYKMVHPETPVVAFTGDAGMEMVLGDLATIRDAGLPIVIIVFVDESLALIELKQRAMKYDNAGVDFKETDFVSIGRAYGFHSEWVEDTQTLESELQAALIREYTTLLACRFPRQAYDDAF
jgi:acetolactate synthase-1/2/3 large subunit